MSYNWSGGSSVQIVFGGPAVCPCGCRDPRNVVVAREEIERLREAAGQGEVRVTLDFVREVQRLCHPDLHAAGRRDKATRVAAFCSRVLATSRKVTASG